MKRRRFFWAPAKFCGLLAGSWNPVAGDFSSLRLLTVLRVAFVCARVQAYVCCNSATERKRSVRVYETKRPQLVPRCVYLKERERVRESVREADEGMRDRWRKERQKRGERQSSEDARCWQTKRDDGGGNEKPYTFITRCPLDRATAAGKTFH